MTGLIEKVLKMGALPGFVTAIQAWDLKLLHDSSRSEHSCAGRLMRLLAAPA
jgi:hypothetical protein